MPPSPKIQYAPIGKLNLDPTNPRLGRRIASSTLSQKAILEEMGDWTLDELAVSFLESGFWPQEALIVVREALYKKPAQFVVIEGNRRLAALKQLDLASKGGSSRHWRELLAEHELPEDLLESIPYIEVKSRKDVSAYLGFRHVSGIKEWKPAEKAQYIAKLIEDEGLSYDEVRRRIGSKVPTVRQNYISYRLLLQMDEQESIAMDKVEEKFSVLYLSLRTQGVQNYLHIDVLADPKKARMPVPKAHIKSLINFSKWLFGDKKNEPLFTDSRRVDSFGKLLDSPDGVAYLERTAEPRFEMALRKAGVGQDEVIELIQQASDSIQLALTEVHQYKRNDQVKKAVKTLGGHLLALLTHFPSAKNDLKNEFLLEAQEDAGTS